MLFLSTIFFVLTFVSGKTTKVEINSGNRQNFVLSADEDEIFADFKEFLKSGKATEKSLIDWALINGCKIVVGELQNKFKYGGSDCSANISQLEEKVAQICNQKIGSSASILADKSALIKMETTVAQRFDRRSPQQIEFNSRRRRTDWHRKIGEIYRKSPKTSWKF
uniref:Uncharacterized protein n=1 Tax=Globodera rostochiensis TaxID=31243 RepID=A0A914IAS1_GLORO